MKHTQFDYLKKIVEANIPCLIQGPAGTSKSTTAMQVLEELDLKLHSITCTRQTSVNNLLGFLSVTGEYIPSQLRQAFEHGGGFILEEQNAADSNVLICLNSMENGFLAFPDKIVYKHKDFRFIATANPNDNLYSARNNMDFSVNDRLHTINFHPDPALELALTSQPTVELMQAARKFLSSHGSSIQATMRDAIRVEQLTKLAIPNPIVTEIFSSDEALGELFKTELVILKEDLIKEQEQAKFDKLTQHDMTTYDDFLDKVKQQGK